MSVMDAAQLSSRAERYMAKYMAMRNVRTEQMANQVWRHMVQFAKLEEQRAKRLARKPRAK